MLTTAQKMHFTSIKKHLKTITLKIHQYPNILQSLFPIINLPPEIKLQYIIGKRLNYTKKCLEVLYIYVEVVQKLIIFPEGGKR